MEICDFLTPDHTQCRIPGVSKKKVLEHLSHLIADNLSDIDADQLYQQFLERERLGSTGIGDGIAIPHCRVPGCSKITGALLKLEDEVDFDAIDDKPVDLVFALVVPEEENEEHLKTLACIAEKMQIPENRMRLRKAACNKDLFEEAIKAD